MNFSPSMRIGDTQAAKSSDRMSIETATPLACAGCTVWRGFVLVGVKKGGGWVSWGVEGGLGHLGIRFARALGGHCCYRCTTRGPRSDKKGGARMWLLMHA